MDKESHSNKIIKEKARAEERRVKQIKEFEAKIKGIFIAY